MPKLERKSYSREFKLQVIDFYHAQKRKSKYAVYTHFRLAPKSVREWIRDEEKIRSQKKGSKAQRHREAFFPDVEKQLFDEFKSKREQRLKIKGFWFKTRGQQIFEENHPDKDFKFSNNWFDGFKKRYRISYRQKTNTAQKRPKEYENEIRAFHKKIRRIQLRQKIRLSSTGNMDQTPVPFSFLDGKTYALTGEKDISVQPAASGLDKRQCTVMPTLFGDGDPRLKCHIVFRGDRKTMPKEKERKQYDSRVYVTFQENAWVDEPTMLDWVKNMWHSFANGFCKERKLLLLDHCSVHKMESVRNKLKQFNTEVVYIPEREMARTLPFTNDCKFEYHCAVRGYHAYMKTANPCKGTEFVAKQEPQNKKDNFACLAVSGNKTYGHLPYEIAHICFHFLSHGRIEGITTGKRRRNEDTPTGGLEIPCILTFVGKKTQIDKLNQLLIKNKRKCVETWNT